MRTPFVRRFPPPPARRSEVRPAGEVSTGENIATGVFWAIALGFGAISLISLNLGKKQAAERAAALQIK